MNALPKLVASRTLTEAGVEQQPGDGGHRRRDSGR